MRKVFTTLLVSLVLPLVAFAAFNDVQLSSGTTLVITVGSSNLQFSAYDGNVQDVQVAAGSVTFTMAPGSTVSISSTDRKTFTYQVSKTIATATCTDTASILGLALASSEASNEVVTVTPTGSTCVIPGTSGGGGGGGNGGGSSTTPAPTPAPASTPVPAVAQVLTAVSPTVPAPEVAKPSPVAQLVSPVFNKNLQLGSKGDDVKRLQELLKTDKDVYPEGQVTGYLGSLTKAAIIKFQLKHGVIKSNKERGAGRLGPKTRAKIKEIFEGSSPKSSTEAPAASAPSSNSSQTAKDQLQLLLKQVQDLQAQLKAKQGY